MRSPLSLLAVALVSAQVLVASEPAATPPDPKVPQGANLDVPSGWKVRPDIADPKLVVGKETGGEGIYFVNMTPGWHVTTGPAAIFYHPASTAKGDYRVKAKIHFFKPEAGHREGYGIFFAGANLEAADQTYAYFLLRNDRKFLIKKRLGAETEMLLDWTESPAIVTWEPGGKDSVTNELTVDLVGAEATVFVNGQQVAAMSRAELPPGEIAGLRFNHHVNVHVSDFAVTPITAKSGK